MSKIQLRIALWHGVRFGDQKRVLTGNFGARLATLTTMVEKARSDWLDQVDGSWDGPVLKIFVGPEGLLIKEDKEYALDKREITAKSGTGESSDTMETEGEANKTGFDLKTALSGLSEGLLLIPGTVVYKKEVTPDKLEEMLKTYKDIARRNGIDFWKAKHPEQGQEAREKVGEADAFKLEKKIRFLLGEKISKSPESAESMNWPQIPIYVARNAAYAFHESLGPKPFKYLKQSENKVTHKTTEIAPADKHVAQRRIKFIPGYAPGVFQVKPPGGPPVTCGIEICADHQVGQLKFSKEGGASVDLHFIVSDYVYNAKLNNAAKPGGYVIHASTVKSADTIAGVYNHNFEEIPEGGSYPYKDGSGTGLMRYYALELEVDD